MEATERDRLLYGRDATEAIVGIDYDDDANEAVSFVRRDGGMSENREGFQPFILLTDNSILARTEVEPAKVEELKGNGLRLLARFTTAKDYETAMKSFAAEYRKHKNDYAEEPYYEAKDFPHQYMLLSGRTHFLGMAWTDVRQIELTLKLNVNPELANPRDTEQAMLVLGIKMGDQVQALHLGKLTEAEMIARLVEAVQECDPDVISGHNLFKFILPFLFERARRYKVPLKLGRGGRPVAVERYRMPLAERRLEFPRFRVFGRSLLDSWILVQSYDIFKREMDSYELPYCASYLGVSESERQPHPLPRAGEDHGPYLDGLTEDARADLEETAGVVGTLVGTFFYLCQMLPYTLEDTVIKGNATKINSFFLREYLARGEAIPHPVEGRFFPGGFTDIRKTGVIAPVISADVASLYPSLILAKKLFPKSDRLGLYELILRELLARRLEIKRQLKELPHDSDDYAQLDARQGTFKIIINSFYGYLGTGRMNFADLDAAEKVTAAGQETVKQMAQVIDDLNGEIIEIDTDGIYLRPPNDHVKKRRYEDFIRRVNERMPEGVLVELGGVYRAMLSYKVKNYALLAEDGRLIVKGSGLKSRGLEPFLRRFIEESIRLVLTNRAGELKALYERFRKRLAEGDMPVGELAKTDILVDSLATYEKKIETTRRNRQAQYEVAKRSGQRFKPGDPVTYYISGSDRKVKAYEAAKHINEYDPANPDVNIPFYQKRLEQTYKRIQGFTSEESEKSRQ